jgi:hypothetical protein
MEYQKHILYASQNPGHNEAREHPPESYKLITGKPLASGEKKNIRQASPEAFIIGPSPA